MSAVVCVQHAGILTTVQDMGRRTMQRYGVPVSGAMDRFAPVAANRLVGNHPDAAVLEITAGGTLFEVLAPTVLALTGADFGATLNGWPVDPWKALHALPGMLLALPGRRTDWGARAYLAFHGGIDVPEVLASRSTYLPGGMGGYAGRALRAGDVLDIIRHGAAWPVATPDVSRVIGRQWPMEASPDYRARPVLRALPGPHLHAFAPDALDLLQAQPFHIRIDSNRMGYRLEGPTLAYRQPSSLPSLGVIPGVVQVPPDGVPILLTADAQTTGGYPIIAVVIGADMPLAAQLLPGDSLRFHLITMEAARVAYRRYYTWLQAPLHTDETIEGLALAGALGK